MRPSGWTSTFYSADTAAERDLFNLAESCKPYIDYLCSPKKNRAGLCIIKDDNMHFVREGRITWEYRKGEPGFYIDILALGEAE